MKRLGCRVGVRREVSSWGAALAFGLPLAGVGGGGLFLPPAWARAQSGTASPVPAGAHATVFVEVDGTGIPVERKARRLALEQKCAEVAGGAVPAEQRDEILDRVGELTAVRSNRDLGNGKSRVGVTVFLASPPENKAGLMRLLLRAGLVKPLRVAVVVPEEHRIEVVPVRVPDPAGETAIARYLERAGFANTDPGVAARLRDDVAVRAALKGDLSEEELRDLKRRNAGVDVLIVGEAFSVERRGVATLSGMPTCEANVEVKALDLRTGARICSDREADSGRGLTGATAGKDALEKAGARLAPRVADALLVWMASGRNPSAAGALLTRRIEVQGVAGARLRDAVLAALRSAPDVRITSSEFEGGVLFVEVQASPRAAADLASLLERVSGVRVNGDAAGVIKASMSTER